MVLKVVPADASDAERSVQIEIQAYGPNPLSSALFPGPFPASAPRHLDLVKMLESDPACKWAKVIDTDIKDEGGNEDMIAFSMWYFWDTPQPDAPPQEWGEGNNQEACEMFFGGMREKRNERFRGKPFAYLKLLHTHPDHKRRGAGSMLLKWGAEEADRLGLDSYLEASPEGKRLYEKTGFEVLENWYADFSKWDGPKEHPTAFMLRSAGNTAGA